MGIGREKREGVGTHRREGERTCARDQSLGWSSEAKPEPRRVRIWLSVAAE